ncbi:MAG: hypothetical protein QOK28_3121, partial [Actinomycetota bacterium]
WKFLLTSEIANRVVEIVEQRPPGIPYTEPERQLLEFVEDAPFGIREDFGARFERTIATLNGLSEFSTTESSGRDFVNEALHSAAIARLRSLLGPVLRSKQRVAVLIDNLDKGWERSADLDLLSKLLLGLLSATGRVRGDFAKEDYWRERVELTVATFLRSDIFRHVLNHAREPDKIPATPVFWDNHEILIRVLEERFLAARPEDADSAELWSNFFVPEVNGISVRNYLLSRVLPRPRDLIFFANSAVSSAIDRGRDRIEEEDVLAGEAAYSQFAFESLLVENGISISLFKDVLYEFVGEPAVMGADRVDALVAQAGLDAAHVGAVVKRLQEVSFLGIETAQDKFEFPERPEFFERASVKARKYQDSGNAVRFCVHPAFRAYLEIVDDQN